MNYKNFFLLIFIFFIYSCENNQVLINEDNLILGNWTEPIYDGETTSFTRHNTLPNDAYGISFKQNGDFIERTSGWCGTPPLIYSDYKGSFEIQGTLVKINNEFFPNSFQWRIITLTETELIVKRELSEQEKEHRALMDLFEEFNNLAYSETCIDVSNWTFIAYGSKACGGPQGYIAYSTKIDTITFLQKVEAYTNAEKAFNIKWGIASDCAITNAPKGIECQNGFPTLIY